MKQKEKSALQKLEMDINNRNEINLNKINPKIGEYIHTLWKSDPIQRRFLQSNAKYQGVFFCASCIVL